MALRMRTPGDGQTLPVTVGCRSEGAQLHRTHHQPRSDETPEHPQRLAGWRAPSALRSVEGQDLFTLLIPPEYRVRDDGAVAVTVFQTHEDGSNTVHFLMPDQWPTEPTDDGAALRAVA